MTDPRLGDGLLAAIQRMPAKSGVIFRHYHLPEAERRRLFATVRKLCARRGHMLIVAGDAEQARCWHADGYHGQAARTPASSFQSMPVHDIRELRAAKRLGTALLLISPVHSTRSHPGQRPIGVSQFMRLARLAAPAKVVALGGMSRPRAAMLDKRIVHGWAAIDALNI